MKFIVVFAALALSVSAQRCTPDWDIVDRLTKDGSYNKLAPPSSNVHMTFTVWVADLRFSRNDFFIEMYTNYKYRDNRLNYRRLNPCNSRIRVPREHLDRLWSPELATINTVTHTRQMSPDAGVFVALYENGTVWRNDKVTLQPQCVYEGSFPADELKCSMHFESYAYNLQALNLQWEDNPLLLLSSKSLIGWHINGNSDIHTDVITPTYPMGKWAELRLTVTLHREKAWYVWHSYIPAGLTVVCSWLALFLPRHQYTSKCIVIMLSMVLLFLDGMYTQQSNLGLRLTGPTKMGVWFAGCAVLVLLALVKTIVDAAENGCNCKRREPTDKRGSDTEQGALLEHQTAAKAHQTCTAFCNFCDLAHRVVFAVLFVLFALFNVWWVFL